MSTSRRARLGELLSDVRRVTGEHDLLLYAAGVTFYAAIAAAPIVLVSLAAAAIAAGEQRVERLGGNVADLLPDELGADDIANQIVEAGSGLSLGALLVCVLPATLYGEGLLRAFDRLGREGDNGRLSRGLRGRLLALPLLGAGPPSVLGVMTLTAAVRDALSGGGAGRGLLAVYLTFLIAWVLLSLLLLFAYALIARDSPGTRALLWGSFGTGSFLAGFLLGFVLFLGLDLPLAAPFGGFYSIGLAVAGGLWAYLLHAIVLVGYVVTLRLGAREGHPLSSPQHPSGAGQTPVVARG